MLEAKLRQLAKENGLLFEVSTIDGVKECVVKNRDGERIITALEPLVH